MPKKTILSWSSGKDSAWALHRLRQRTDLEITGLFTTVNQASDRVAVHAVRLALLRAQADAAGLPLQVVFLPNPCTNANYEDAMHTVIEDAKKQGVESMAFGDLFLADIRAYREAMLKGTGIAPLFPLWAEPTETLAREMIAGGLKAVVTCADPKQLPAEFAGREFNAQFLADLPEGVDPCGEKGEFHTFTFGGPMFRRNLEIEVGEVVQRDGFVYADVLPAERVNG